MRRRLAIACAARSACFINDEAAEPLQRVVTRCNVSLHIATDRHTLQHVVKRCSVSFPRCSVCFSNDTQSEPLLCLPDCGHGLCEVCWERCVRVRARARVDICSSGAFFLCGKDDSAYNALFRLQSLRMHKEGAREVQGAMLTVGKV